MLWCQISRGTAPAGLRAGWTAIDAIAGVQSGGPLRRFPRHAARAALDWITVRGDSRRDLYAKSLALCGLGVLAGVGALVDYWPVAIRFPTAAAAVTPRVPAPLPVPADAFDRVGRVRLALDAQAARRPVPASAPAPTPERTNVERTEAAPALLASVVPPSEDVALSRIATVRRLPGPPPPRPALPQFDTPPSTSTLVLLDAPDPGPAGTADDRGGPGGGVLVNAFRATGQSLARTGAATGASLAGAFRRVGSAVRWALP